MEREMERDGENQIWSEKKGGGEILSDREWNKRDY